MAGYEPFVEDVFLTKGMTFAHYFECTPDDPFPPGTTSLFRVLYRDTLATFLIVPAVIVEPGGVQVQLVSTDADTIPEGFRWQLSVKTPTGPTTCWRRGTVWRKD